MEIARLLYYSQVGPIRGGSSILAQNTRNSVWGVVTKLEPAAWLLRLQQHACLSRVLDTYGPLKYSLDANREEAKEKEELVALPLWASNKGNRMLGLFREDFSLQAKVMCKDVVTKRAVGSLSLVTLNNWYIVVLATVYTCSAWGTVFPLLTLLPEFRDADQ